MGLVEADPVFSWVADVAAFNRAWHEWSVAAFERMRVAFAPTVEALERRTSVAEFDPSSAEICIGRWPPEEAELDDPDGVVTECAVFDGDQSERRAEIVRGLLEHVENDDNVYVRLYPET